MSVRASTEPVDIKTGHFVHSFAKYVENFSKMTPKSKKEKLAMIDYRCHFTKKVHRIQSCERTPHQEMWNER